MSVRMPNPLGTLRRSATQLRTVAGLASIIPATAVAIGVAGVTGNRRHGVNFFTSVWPGAVLSTAGVGIDLVGGHNLTTQRPAVFIFNHRNLFDVFIAAALVRNDWTAVGKKELENDPIAGTVGRLVDAVFVDRDDIRSAVEGLRKIEELAKKGLSVIVAPEGTRVSGPGVGQFKKGPFRIAMSAGIPLVPIVIRNAESIAVRDSILVRPGRVQVAVLEPIATKDWTLAELPDRIADVRQSFVDTLDDWPMSVPS